MKAHGKLIWFNELRRLTSHYHDINTLINREGFRYTDTYIPRTIDGIYCIPYRMEVIYSDLAKELFLES